MYCVMCVACSAIICNWILVLFYKIDTATSLVRSLPMYYKIYTATSCTYYTFKTFYCLFDLVGPPFAQKFSAWIYSMGGASIEKIYLLYEFRKFLSHLKNEQRFCKNVFETFFIFISIFFWLCHLMNCWIHWIVECQPF